jgi:hypothetical protein
MGCLPGAGDAVCGGSCCSALISFFYGLQVVESAPNNAGRRPEKVMRLHPTISKQAYQLTTYQLTYRQSKHPVRTTKPTSKGLGIVLVKRLAVCMYENCTI